MAGHSQFKNIMHRKGAQDAKRAKVFNKIIREITVAARISPDADANPRLRAALGAARVANMPKDNIERALKKALGAGDGVIYEEIRYEGYGPGGIAIIIEALTDNRNRTTADIRSAFSKFGGSLGETGSVSFMFEHVGFIRIPVAGASYDQVFEKAVEAGAQNVESQDDAFDVTTEMESFATVRDSLATSFGDMLESKLIWRPLSLIVCEQETAPTLLKLIDVLEDNDDIQHIFANYDIPESVLAKLV